MVRTVNKYLIITNNQLINKNRSEEVNNTLQFLNDLCIKHGSTYKGRIDACKSLLNINQKVPLLISELTLEIWFPILSSKNKDNIWLNYNEILSYKATQDNKTIFKFKNGYTYEIPFNSRIIKNQMMRCEELIKKMSQK